ncbi:MAG: hypothetical protein ACOYJ2_08240 [Rickettsiales bacterium]
MKTSALPDFEQYAAQLVAAGRICVMGIYWDKLFTIITGSKKRDNNILPNPLILGGWVYSDDEHKKERFMEHLRYAYDNGKWDGAMKYLESVPESAWHIADMKI